MLFGRLKKSANWKSSLEVFCLIVKSIWFWFILSVLFVLLAGLAFFIFRDWLGENESFTAAIRNFVLVIAAAIGLPLAIWRSMVAQRQASTSHRQSETAQHSLLNERYQKGAEMLGSDVLTDRLGGIYALQRLANEHADQYHVQIMRLFSAFLRSKQYSNDDESIVHETDSLEPSIAVQAVMDAIAAREESSVSLEKQAGYKIDLRRVKLCSVSLEQANLSNARLSWANLEQAALRCADLSGSILNQAVLTDATLGGTNLHDARLNRASLVNAVFWTSWPPGPPRFTSYCKALLEGKVISADLSSSEFNHSNLSGASLQGVNLSNSKLSECNLSRAVFTNAILSGANLSGAKFSENGMFPATELTQTQIDSAWADPKNPPTLTGVIDAETELPIVWSG